MPDPVETPPEPRNLRALRWLVTGLTAAMIVGLILVVTLLVIRLRAPAPVLPDDIDLPADARARAVTVAEDMVLVVTDGDLLLVYDRFTGRLIREMPLN